MPLHTHTSQDTRGFLAGAQTAGKLVHWTYDSATNRLSPPTGWPSDMRLELYTAASARWLDPVGTNQSGDLLDTHGYTTGLFVEEPDYMMLYCRSSSVARALWASKLASHPDEPAGNGQQYAFGFTTSTTSSSVPTMQGWMRRSPNGGAWPPATFLVPQSQYGGASMSGQATGFNGGRALATIPVLTNPLIYRGVLTAGFRRLLKMSGDSGAWGPANNSPFTVGAETWQQVEADQKSTIVKGLHPWSFAVRYDGVGYGQ